MSDSNETRNPVERLAEEFVERCRRGEHPTVAEYTEAHPVWAEQIREVFPTLLALEELKSDHHLCAGLSGERAADYESPPERIGDFRILRTIGRGGMGVVYEAEQESLGRRVAIKVLAASYASSPQAVRRFRREAQAAARLHHTNIVSVFGVGEREGKHFYVMQYIEGRSLDGVVAELSGRHAETVTVDRPAEAEHGEPAKLTEDYFGVAVARALLRGRFGPVSPQPGDATGAVTTRHEGDSQESSAGAVRQQTFPQQPNGGTALGASGGLGGEARRCAYWRSVAGIGVQVAAALHYAHRQGILHRDIKPGNVILDEKGVAWLTDFGLAKLVDQEDLTHPGDVVGTLRYMAPEQLEGKTSASSDLYSLGLTLYELLTLRPAFNETSRHLLLHQVSQQDPPRPRTIIPDIPRDLETIVLKAMAREPVHRYETAGELADDLQRFLEDRPIRARRTSAVEHAWRWCRRNPALATLTTTTILLLVGGIVGSSAGYVREAGLRAQAEAESRRAEANLAIAAEAFEDVFSKVSGEPLPHAFEKAGDDVWIGDAGLPAVGKKDALVLEGLLRFYDRFAAQNRDNTKWQHQSGQAYRRVGDIQQRLGRFREAKEAYGGAIGLYEHLVQSASDEADFVVELAAIHIQLGNMALATDRFDEAFRQYALAETTVTREGASASASPVGQFQLAEAYRAMGMAAFLQRMLSSMPEGPAADTPDAEVCLRKALAILSALAAGAHARGEYRQALAECYGNLWGVCHFSQRGEEADEAKRQAIGILEELVAAFPDNPQYRQTLAWTYAITNDSRTAGDQEDSVAPLQKALALMGEVPAPYLEAPEYRRTLAHVNQGLAEALFERGQDDLVELPLQRSIELLAGLKDQFPEIPLYRAGLGRSYYLLAVLQNGRGQVESARDALEQVLDVLGTIEVAASGRSPVIALLARTYTGLADVRARLGEPALAEEAAAKARELWTLERGVPFKRPEGDVRDPWGRNGD